VEGSETVSKAVFGVDACQALFEFAAAKKAGFIFTHHGLSWGPGFKTVTGLTAARLRTLLKNNISLYSAHLPLDAHPEIGHNALIAKMLGLKNTKPFAEYHGSLIGVAGELSAPAPAADIAAKLAKKLGSGDCVVYGCGADSVKKIGVIAGGGASLVTEAVKDGLDCFVTGEGGHSQFHTVKESGIPVITLGHYRTEIPGVMAVMEKIRSEFGLECEFADIPTGM
jgi:dinuclear metal center YbgI/SA1388 family protein